MTTPGSYLWHVAAAWSQFVNAVCGGDRDETLSSRVGRAHLRGDPRARLPRLVIDGFFRLLTGERDHCVNNIGT